MVMHPARRAGLEGAVLDAEGALRGGYEPSLLGLSASSMDMFAMLLGVQNTTNFCVLAISR